MVGIQFDLHLAGSRFHRVKRTVFRHGSVSGGVFATGIRVFATGIGVERFFRKDLVKRYVGAPLSC